MLKKTRNYFLKSPSGFTLIELLVVIAVIGVLAAIVVSVVGNVRQSAMASQSVSNLRQLQLANMAYAAANNGNFVSLHEITYSETGEPQHNYGRPWAINPEFAEFVAAIIPDTPDYSGDWISIAKSAFKVDPYGDGGTRTIGYNQSDVWGGSLNLNAERRWNIRMSDLTDRSARVIAFGESVGEFLEIHGANNWTPEGDITPGSLRHALAFRNRGLAPVVTFEGNVLQISSENAADEQNWFLGQN